MLTYYKTETIVTKKIDDEGNRKLHQEKVNKCLKILGKAFSSLQTEIVQSEPLGTFIHAVTTITYLVSENDKEK